MGGDVAVVWWPALDAASGRCAGGPSEFGAAQGRPERQQIFSFSLTHFLLSTPCMTPHPHHTHGQGSHSQQRERSEGLLGGQPGLALS